MAVYLSVCRSVTIFKAPVISPLPAGHLSSKNAEPQAQTHTCTHITPQMCIVQGYFSILQLSQQPTSMSLVISQSLFVSKTNTNANTLCLGSSSLAWSPIANWPLPPPAGCCSSPVSQSGCLLCGHSWRMRGTWLNGLAWWRRATFRSQCPSNIADTSRRFLMHTNCCSIYKLIKSTHSDLHLRSDTKTVSENASHVNTRAASKDYFIVIVKMKNVETCNDIKSVVNNTKTIYLMLYIDIICDISNMFETSLLKISSWFYAFTHQFSFVSVQTLLPHVVGPKGHLCQLLRSSLRMFLR